MVALLASIKILKFFQEIAFYGDRATQQLLLLNQLAQLEPDKDLDHTGNLREVEVIMLPRFVQCMGAGAPPPLLRLLLIA